jgi:L-lactate dehydrogenase complex protein LldF
VISPYLQPGVAAPDLPFASSLCGACADACPVKIDLPGLLVHQRARAMRGDVAGEAVPGRRAQKLAMRTWATAMRSPRRYRLASWLLRATLRPFVREGRVRWLPGMAGGWTRARDFPAPAPRTFQDLWRERRLSGVARQGSGASLPRVERNVTASHPEAPGAAPGTSWDLVDTFARAAAQADAIVAVARAAAEASRIVAEALDCERARLVTVSPGAMTLLRPVKDAAYDGGTRVVTRSETLNDRGELLTADAGVTVATLGIADTGTLVLCASPADHRLDSLLPPVHVALVHASALVRDLPSAFARLAGEDWFARHSAVTFVRGPSRTADIELTLTIGVHGPRKLYVIVLDDR